MLDWYFTEWLAATNMTQADVVRATGYPKAKVSDLATGKQRYNRDILNDVAKALNIYSFELLMDPEDAMAYRRMKRSAEHWVRVPFGGTAGDHPDEGAEDERWSA